ncbi:MAG: hypothetical protein ACI4EF_00310, partial [Coprococcus sp.]
STGRYKIGECMTYNGCDLWHDGRIILLVNAETVSAGDHLTKLMSEYPNVTVMGFTHTSCSAQGINGVTFDHGMLSYSAVLLLNEDGTIFIDTDKERESTVPLDIKVPFDENAVKSLFDDNSDYLLECAMEEFRHPTAK